MKDLQKDIQSGNWKQVYLLFGEEDYLRQQYKNRLLKALNPDEDTMNYSIFSGKDINPAEIPGDERINDTAFSLCETRQ